MKIKYIGKAAREIDSKAGTGVVWNGPGDVQEVPDWAAPKLLRFKDMWEQVGETDSAAMAESLRDHAAEVKTEEDAGIWRTEVTARMQNMDKAQLEQFAKSHFNVDLDKRRSAEKLRQEIDSLIDRYGLPE